MESTARVWICEQCKHIWLMGEIVPTHCAKCRSRRWNDGMDKHDTRTAVERGGNRGGLPVLQNAESETQRLHPMQPVRRELVGGDGTASRSEDVREAKPTQGISIPGVSRGFASLDKDKVELPKPASLVPGEIPICGKTWWEEGENYECLMDKWHKNIKCGQRGMVRNITD